jgi:putative hydrolase of the HAD superfamily
VIRAVLFDLDDTLCDDRGQMRRAILESATVAVGPERGDALGRAYEEISDRYWYHELTLAAPPPLAVIREKLWRAALETVVGEVDPVALQAALTRYDAMRREPIPPLPDALFTLSALKDAGLKLAILTNGLSETHFAKAEALGVLPFIENVFTPDTLGVAKPDARAFHHVCDFLQTTPEETVHVGDSLVTDVGGALGAGLRAIWFNPNESPGEYEQIASLAELIGRLTG